MKSQKQPPKSGSPFLSVTPNDASWIVSMLVFQGKAADGSLKKPGRF
jgi:hypothetical protein